MDRRAYLRPARGAGPALRTRLLRSSPGQPLPSPVRDHRRRHAADHRHQDDRVVAAIVILDPRALDADDREVLGLLGALGGAVVVADLAHRAAESYHDRVDLELLSTLDEVRGTQDQVGNSIAVVLGWLRLLANSSSAASTNRAARRNPDRHPSPRGGAGQHRRAAAAHRVGSPAPCRQPGQRQRRVPSSGPHQRRACGHLGAGQCTASRHLPH